MTAFQLCVFLFIKGYLNERKTAAVSFWISEVTLSHSFFCDSFITQKRCVLMRAGWYWFSECLCVCFTERAIVRAPRQTQLALMSSTEKPKWPWFSDRQSMVWSSLSKVCQTGAAAYFGGNRSQSADSCWRHFNCFVGIAKLW